jgi:AraC-like DNA-binding protein
MESIMTLPEKTHYWFNRDLGIPFDALTATYFTHAFARHIHEGYAIGIIERGAEAFYYRRQIEYAPQGTLVVVQPGELHTGEAVTLAEGWSYRMIYPAADLVRRAAEELTGIAQGIPYFPQGVIRDPELFTQFQQMHLLLEHAQDALERETQLLWFLSRLVRRHAAHKPALSRLQDAPQALQQAVNFLHAQYPHAISLEQLAQTVYLSPFHLSRLFRERLGVPPHTYLNQIRVQQAQHLLRQGESLAAVAVRVGFADQAHFSKAFKRIVGVSPGQYRKI